MTPKELIDHLCNGWLEAHPEDYQRPWQIVLRKLLRVHAMTGKASMFIQTSHGGAVVSGFALVDRKTLGHPFHG